MGDSRYAKSSVKSGSDFAKQPEIHGGMPAKKSVEAVDKENMPKTAPGSVMPK